MANEKLSKFIRILQDKSQTLSSLVQEVQEVSDLVELYKVTLSPDDEKNLVSSYLHAMSAFDGLRSNLEAAIVQMQEFIPDKNKPLI